MMNDLFLNESELNQSDLPSRFSGLLDSLENIERENPNATSLELLEKESNELLDEISEQVSKDSAIPEFVKKLFKESIKAKEINPTFKELLSGKEIINGNSTVEKFALNTTQALEWLERFLKLRNNKKLALIIFSNRAIRNSFSLKFFTDPVFCASLLKKALQNKHHTVVEMMWKGNEKLQAYFSGQAVNLSTNESPNVQQISLTECITYFKSALWSCCPEIITAMWNGNLQLQAYFSGQDANLGTDRAPNVQKMSLTECITNFKSVLASHCPEVINAIWDNNAQLRAYFSGEAVNLGTTEFPNIQQISLTECITNFKSALSSQNRNLITAMWNGNLQLQAYFSGKAINSCTNEPLKVQQISLTECITNFKSALASHCTEVIKAMWNGNPQLQTYFSGQAINSGTNGPPNEQQILLKKCITNFKSALSSQNRNIIKTMWNGNLQLQAYFSGQAVNLGTNESPNVQQISLTECITNFKSALASHCPEVIKAMWDSNIKTVINQLKQGIEVNKAILEVITVMPDNNAKKVTNQLKQEIEVNKAILIELTEKVLSSTPSGKGRFINEFLSNMDESILVTVQNKIKPEEGKKITAYKQNQLNNIQRALQKLATNSTHQNDDGANSIQTSATPSRKRRKISSDNQVQQNNSATTSMDWMKTPPPPITPLQDPSISLFTELLTEPSSPIFLTPNSIGQQVSKKRKCPDNQELDSEHALGNDLFFTF